MLRRGEFGAGDQSSKPAHAVTDEGDVLGIDTVFRGRVRLADRLHDRPNIFDHMNKEELTTASPGAALVKEDGIPTRTANRLGQIEIPLVAGKFVE
jgi:hypothetical protein